MSNKKTKTRTKTKHSKEKEKLKFQFNAVQYNMEKYLCAEAFLFFFLLFFFLSLFLSSFHLCCSSFFISLLLFFIACERFTQYFYAVGHFNRWTTNKFDEGPQRTFLSISTNKWKCSAILKCEVLTVHVLPWSKTNIILVWHFYFRFKENKNVVEWLTL